MSPTAILRSRAGAAWAVLVLATLVSWYLGAGHGAVDARRFATTVIIVVAFVKVALVGRYFMGLDEAPALLNLAFNGWIVTITTVLVVMNLST